MTVYLVALAVLLLTALAWGFAAPESLLGCLRHIPILAMYPLFVAMAATEGLRTAGLYWSALTCVALVLVFIAQMGLPRTQRAPLFGAVWRTALLWPLIVPATSDTVLIRLGILPRPAEPRLPEPPRGAELIALPDDEMLVAVHQILAGQETLTAEERTIFVAETFNREMHGGGLRQWLSNTDSSVSHVVEALRTVGAGETARLLQEAADAIPARWSEAQPLESRRRALEPIAIALRSFDDRFFALERQEDLTFLVARFVRRYRSRCPALERGLWSS